MRMTRRWASLCPLLLTTALACEDTLLVEPATAPAQLDVRFVVTGASTGAASAYDRADSVHVAVFAAGGFDPALLRRFADDFTANGAAFTTTVAFRPQAETRVQLDVGQVRSDTILVLAALSRARVALFVGQARQIVSRDGKTEIPITLIP